MNLRGLRRVGSPRRMEPVEVGAEAEAVVVKPIRMTNAISAICEVIGQAHVRTKPPVPNAREVLVLELVMRSAVSNATRRAILVMLVQGNLQRHEDVRSRPPLPAEAKAHEVDEGLQEGNVPGDQANRHLVLQMVIDA